MEPGKEVEKVDKPRRQKAPRSPEKPVRPAKEKKAARPTPPALNGHAEAIALTDIDQSNTRFQCRLSVAVSDLRRSLEHDGQKQPVDLVGPQPYRIVDGFRRCKAALELGWASVTGIVHDLDDSQALRVAFTKNVVRKNLAPMDRANALWMAQKQGMKKGELSEVFGLSEKQVDRYLELLSFAPVLQKIIDGNVVTMAHAKALHDMGVAEPAEWKKRIDDEKLSAKQLKTLLRKESGNKKPGRKKLYVKKTKDNLRFYPFSVSKDATPGEKERVRKLLKEALDFLSE